MIEESRVEYALACYSQGGYSCSQSVVCAYAKALDADPEVLFALSEGFGSGMAGLRGVCGAVTAMSMVAGLKNSAGMNCAGASKAQTYRLIRELTDEFSKKNSSIICAELIGSPTTPKLRSCPGCIEDACKIIEEKLF